MSDYPQIADHGLIGDLQTAALVATDGTIDWFCCPRFDSPSVFASLLDSERGGRFRIAPVGDGCVTRQLYLPDSASLITRFLTPDGVGEVVDLMPVVETGATARHRIVRTVRVVRGALRFAFECEPRFDYGRRAHDVELSEHGAVFRTDDLTLTLSCSVPLERRGNDVRGERTLQAGQTAVALLESAAEGGPRRVTASEMDALAGEALRFWRDWLARCTYRGRWWDMVRRSAITLKLMTYAPTGGLVAAPTMGLPEQVGGERNWDYRFTWVRDASLSVQALLGLGFQDEAAAYLLWLNDRARESAGDGPSGPLQIMYRVDGSAELSEETLDHLEGYRGSRPVRAGNAAADQLQLDIYGELIDALYDADRHGLRVGYEGWRSVLGLVEWLGANWDRPEEGIWETRGGRRDFVYGRLMSWVAMDRALRLAEEHGMPADVERLRGTRDLIYEQVMARGWNPRVGAFTQHYGSDVLDASILQMSRVGFVVPTEVRWLATLRAVRRELVSDSLVYRYNPSASPDGLRGSEGTFSLCTFLYAEALARSGYLDEARLTFEKMLSYANHVGLFAEEIGLTGEQLGNFPQAFTHLALINAAIALDDAVDHDRGVDVLRRRLETRMPTGSKPDPVPAA
jgi:GH15 family glucan-1,4-alpha-glucosidase